MRFRWNEVSWPYNTITDGENVTQEALANILGIFDYLKNSGNNPESAATTQPIIWLLVEQSSASSLVTPPSSFAATLFPSQHIWSASWVWAAVAKDASP